MAVLLEKCSTQLYKDILKITITHIITERKQYLYGLRSLKFAMKQEKKAHKRFCAVITPFLAAIARFKSLLANSRINLLLLF